ncbi:MAG: polysaccharide biosynthesis/export family protein [Prosthecobacter sp.]|jgi:polysaccharide export outer membrane protein|uniref:polysaccharide biosynthesis/export family protein n=1 Tax=Prosthecobacter sp. TaxID=1965333 RepID=UPI0019F9868D|nr:polysaccharide biosynthesis/export family protein [Prosthecobacter sp.]MBE2286265.1 polysaccharide biosynthesis/export family protein [Prosthecobacter sp.]
MFLKPCSLPLLLILSSCSLVKGPRFDARDDSAAAPAFTQSAPKAAIDPQWLQKPDKAYTLGPGDKLEIEILGETGTRTDTFVTPDAKIYYDLLPGLDVAGKTTQQLQTELETQLTKYYKQPQVAVTLRDAVSQRVWVLGRLNAPGIYPLKQPMRVLDAISQAGGLFTSRFTGTTEELADLQHSFLIRRGRMLPVDFQKLVREGDMTQNVYLEPDDYVYLPSALTNEVYVLGAVTEPRPIGFMSDMNLMSALGRGLGIRPDADLRKVSIIRGSLTEPKIATVNALDIMTGKATNVTLEPGDIVYVPGAGSISPIHLAKEAVNTFVRLVAATEGSHAGAPNAQSIGLNVNIGGGSN